MPGRSPRRTRRSGRPGGWPSRFSGRARPNWRTGWKLHAASPRFRVVRLCPTSRPRRRSLCQGDGSGRLGRGTGRPPRRDVHDALSPRRQPTPNAASSSTPFRAPRESPAPFKNTGEEGNDPLRLLKRLAHEFTTYTTDLLRGRLAKAVHPDDVVAAKKAGTLCLAFTTNGVPLTQRGVSERDELRVVRLFHHFPLLGVRMMHLTYNRRNPLGDGAGEPNDGGLSDFGREAITELNRLGVIVDVAHSGWRTSREAARASSRPMVASHTTCAGLYKHFRGKPDETVRAICDTGGLIGICCIPRFLGGPGDISAFLDHIDYAVKRFGAKHVAIRTRHRLPYLSERRGRASEAAQAQGRPIGPRPRRPSLGAPLAGRQLQGNPSGHREPRLDQLAAVHRRHGPALAIPTTRFARSSARTSSASGETTRRRSPEWNDATPLMRSACQCNRESWSS